MTKMPVRNNWKDWMVHFSCLLEVLVQQGREGVEEQSCLYHGWPGSRERGIWTLSYLFLKKKKKNPFKFPVHVGAIQGRHPPPPLSPPWKFPTVLCRGVPQSPSDSKSSQVASELCHRRSTLNVRMQMSLKGCADFLVYLSLSQHISRCTVTPRTQEMELLCRSQVYEVEVP